MQRNPTAVSTHFLAAQQTGGFCRRGIYYRSNFGLLGHLQRVIQLNAKIKHIFRGKNSNPWQAAATFPKEKFGRNQQAQLVQRSLATSLGHAELSGNNVICRSVWCVAFTD
jgi:hypothetical protein